MKVQRATSRDLPALERLLRQLHPERPPAMAPLRVRQLSRKFVAKEGAAVQGFLLATFTDYGISPYAMVEELIVDSNARKEGIGTALLEACLAWASSCGAEVVFVSARKDAEAFYVAHEFARCTGPWLYRVPTCATVPS